MPETFFYPGGKPWMPRSYMRGFVGSAGIINMHMASNVLIFDYLSTNIHCEWVVDHRFYPASSNYYSLDFVLDGPASSTYVNGVLTPGNSAIRFVAMPNEPYWRIQVLATLSLLVTQNADLPSPPSSYWRTPV